MVAGCLACLVSPDTASTALPAAIGVLAGSSAAPPQGAGVAACGLVTLGAGSLVVSQPGFSLLGASLAVTGGLIAGLWRGQYQLRAQQAELAATQAQRAEQEHIRAQVLDERARIAREIHDILAHTLGGLVVQLDAADALLSDGGDPDGSRRLLVGARRLAVEGLEETRQAVAALRADPVDLPEALAALAGDGRPGRVSHEMHGTPRQLAPEASLAVYRTAQEALANARKHAPGAAVAMTLSFGERSAVLRVVSGTPPGAPDGCAADPLAATGGGYGLDGLTERAELLGGTLHAGPGEDGWVVELEVPG
jgi:signal transduction histidine kinase